MKKYRKSVAKYGIYALAIASLVGICVATLYPFKFALSPNISLITIFSSFQRTSVLKDYVSNVILFIPWGFALAGILRQRKLNYFIIFLISILISFCLSLSVETIQFFSERRVSNFSDVAFNTVGGGVGSFIYWANQPIINFVYTLASRNRHRLTPKYVGLAFITYFAIVYLIVFSLVSNINLYNWSDNFPFLVGNEATGDRHWKGRINQLHIGDRALSSSEIETAFREKEVFWLKSGIPLASYLFSDVSDLFPNGQKDNRQNSDFNNMFDNPVALVWQQESKVNEKNAVEDNLSITLDRDRWLKSSGSTLPIIRKLKHKNQFTIATIVATNDTKYSDRSRIFSISKSPYNRNFTIAQKEENLILRLRTPVTGANGNEPEILIPHIFKDLEFHYLIFTFDGRQTNIYIDNINNKYSFNFEPEVTFWSYFPFIIPDWQVDLSNFNKLSYCIGFYGILFFPLGCFGGILLFLFARSKTSQIALLIIAGILPSLLIEMLCVAFNFQSIRVFNLIFSTMFLLSIMFTANAYISKRYIT